MSAECLDAGLLRMTVPFMPFVPLVSCTLACEGVGPFACPPLRASLSGARLLV
ncbi:hypothetical protein DVU_2257 [Nitratidesulfovibrio vulgaris str. Hildenborough]|uniref:Uncharacterized protein n=1 Tax=Nitratidesulfovibrio vulgaris (strain ATCC 29579 / DSM 644 / CCUG 34227 / NCIMB 8303 / VKM B-1760 / Hildenborough) TaxID=882 RepID=Q729U2_NITV2|nr:hypothetical protein DVU_2257 [Nitratidesulfovibrio vulgaris str. Hildenborough]